MILKIKMQIVCLSILLLTGCVSNGQKDYSLVSKELENCFISPPNSIQTRIYWYWISDHISKEGVIRDLHVMKDAGINRAFIGNIGLNNLPYVDIKMFSDEWWDFMHLALKTATELEIDIGTFNSPGWNQSGDPCIEPEKAMRYIATYKTYLSGPGKIEHKLGQPYEVFQNVKVSAFPFIADGNSTLTAKNAVIRSVPYVAKFSNVTDGINSTYINFPVEGEFQITFNTDEPFTARSLTIQFAETPLMASELLEAKHENGDFVYVYEFYINRANSALNVGFDPFAPVVMYLPEIVSYEFRLTLKDVSPKSGLAEVALSSVSRIENYSEKTLAKMHPTPLPYWDAYMWLEKPEPKVVDFIINENDILDITQYISDDGTLTWNVPEGEWKVMYIGMTPTGVTNSPVSPKATGLEVDKMSKKWIAEHFDHSIREILRKIPEDDRKTFKGIIQEQLYTKSILQFRKYKIM